MWLLRSSFTYHSHKVHYSVTILMLLLQLQVLDCKDAGAAQDSFVVLHSCAITALVTLISWQVALTYLHAILAIACTLGL